MLSRPTDHKASASLRSSRQHLRPYCRATDLPRLLPLWPEEIADASREGRHRLIQRLRRALREERRRGLAGHWTYDLARHAALFRALQAELASLPPPLSSWAMTACRPATPSEAQH